MARMPIFDSPLLLGFERLEQMLDRTAKAAGDGYPPYNIEQTSENGLRITLAVAGFSMDDLSVAIEDDQLIIRGRNSTDDSGRVFLHRGIAARQFQRSFVLAEAIEVREARLADGLLHIDLERQPPEKTVRTIKIETGKSAGKIEGDKEAKPSPARRGKAIDLRGE
jgi:HSP20 family molecular chaperone IbpA